MTVVAPGSSFTVKFIPKHDTPTLSAFVIYNKQTQVSTTLSAGSTVTYYDNEYYVEADCTYTCTEGEFLRYKVYDDQNNLSYVGTIFVTAQSNYTINSGEYTQNTTANEYITR